MISNNQDNTQSTGLRDEDVPLDHDAQSILESSSVEKAQQDKEAVVASNQEISTQASSKEQDSEDAEESAVYQGKKALQNASFTSRFFF